MRCRALNLLPPRRSVHIAARSFIQERRRARDKALFVPVPADSQPAYFKWPRERLGNTYDLNFLLLRYGIGCHGENSYHQLHTRHLLMRCKGRLDSKRAMQIDARDPLPPFATPAQPATKGKGKAKAAAETTGVLASVSPTPECLFAESPASNVALVLDTYPTLSHDGWNKFMAMMTRHISDSNNLYVWDGSIGTHRKATTGTRVVTNDAEAGLYLKNMVEAVPLNMAHHHHHVFLFHDVTLQPEAPTRLGLSPNTKSFRVDMEMSGQAVLDTYNPQQQSEITADQKEELLRRETGVGMLCGTTSLEELRNALAGLAAYNALKNGHLPLRASALVRKDQTLLVVDPEGKLITEQLADGLFAVDGIEWHPEGILRQFHGITHSIPSLPRGWGNLVQVHPDGTEVITQPLNTVSEAAKALVAPAPKSLLLVLNDTSKTLPALSRVSSSYAASLIESGQGSSLGPFHAGGRVVLEPGLGVMRSMLNERLQTVAIYVANTAHRALSPADVRSLSSRILDGELAPALSQGVDVHPIEKK